MLLYYFVDGEGRFLGWGVKFAKRKKNIKQIPWNACGKLGTLVFGGDAGDDNSRRSQFGSKKDFHDSVVFKTLVTILGIPDPCN